MNEEFDKWWDDEASLEPYPTNNYREDSAAYWAYQGWVNGVAAEREACARVCEAFGQTLEVDVGPNFAEAIRARGEP